MLMIEKVFFFTPILYIYLFLSVHIPLPWSVYFFNYFSQELCCVPYHILALAHSGAVSGSAVQLLALVYQTDASGRMSAQLLKAVVIKVTHTHFLVIFFLFIFFCLGASRLYNMQVLSIAGTKTSQR